MKFVLPFNFQDYRLMNCIIFIIFSIIIIVFAPLGLSAFCPVYDPPYHPDDPHYQDQWALANYISPVGDIDAPLAWDIRTDANPIVVAVIDTGVNYNHQDLAKNMWTDKDGTHGYNVVKNNYYPMDTSGHGTLVAGIIGAQGNNGLGVVGVSWCTRIMAINAMEGGGSPENILKAYQYILDKKTKEGVNIRVVVQSNGAFLLRTIEKTKSKIQELNDNNILLVTASGNESKEVNCGLLSFDSPTCFSNDIPNIISVAASDKSDNLATFSNYSSEYVHLAAPGVDIWSTSILTSSSNSWYKAVEGTSYAAPYVAGAAALLMAQYPNETIAQIKGRILQNVDISPGLIGKVKTGGRLNLYKALGLDILKVSPAGNGKGGIYSESVSGQSSSILCGTLGTSCSATFKKYTDVTLHATPDSGFVFDGWSGDCTGTGDCIVQMYEARNVVATFNRPDFSLVVTKLGKGSGTVISSNLAGIDCGSDCVKNYAAGTSVTLTATPANNSTQFAGWNGDCTGIGTCTVTMDTPKNITATFNPISLTVNKTGTGSGTVNSSPAGISCGGDCSENYTAGTNIILTATPASNSTFAGWSSPCNSTAPTCILVAVNTAKNITAKFDGGSQMVLSVTNLQNDGSGSLRQAIADANNAPGQDTINIGTTGTIVLTSSLEIVDNLVINGPGASQCAISGNNNTFIFSILPGVTVTLNGMTLRDGKHRGSIWNRGTLTLSNSTLSGNHAAATSGGAIHNDFQGTLIVNNSTFSDNHIDVGGVYDGGAIMNYGSLTVRNSIFSGNSATGNGGGIANSGDATINGSTLIGNTAKDGFGGGISCTDKDSLLTINDSVLSNNTANGNYGGGGISVDDCTSSIINSNLHNNHAQYGGGILNMHGLLTVRDSILSDNLANAGGGIYNNKTLLVVNSTLSGNSTMNGIGTGGGGIYNSGNTTIINSTLSGNEANGTISNMGGGIYHGSGILNIFNSTLSNNSASNMGGGIYLDGRLKISNSLIIGNTAPKGKEIATGEFNTLYGFVNIFSQGHNLFGENGNSGIAGVIPASGDLILAGAASTAIGPLADNGGPTWTHLPVTGGPAINGGNNAPVLPSMVTDQRGQIRIRNSVVDIGAVESSESARLNSLKVTKAGPGSGTITSIQAGINCGSDCSENYPAGVSVTLLATPTVGSTFAGWSGACSGKDGCTVSMTAAKSITATFNFTIPTLSVTKAGVGLGTVTSSPAGINCGADCMEPYNFSTPVTLTATPAAGYNVTTWSGCTPTPTDPRKCTVTMDAPKTVTATFTWPVLTVTKGGKDSGSGTVTSNPAGINCGTDCSEAYNLGSRVVLTAKPAAGSTFAGWNGACTGTLPTCFVSMRANQKVTATFVGSRLGIFVD